MYRENYEKWLSSPAVDENTKAELRDLSDDEIKARFYSMLEFGTGGLRGVMGAGLSRMNIYTVRYATQGIANLIKQSGGDGVCIAFDSRNNSNEFAMQSALVLAANGIKVFLFDDIRPTPELSFAVRHLGCVAGINITASHNPSQYNGYKVYWTDGGQIPPDKADIVMKEILEADIFGDVLVTDRETAFKSGLITVIGEEIDNAFVDAVLATAVETNSEGIGDLKIIYTPFHGAGYKLVPRILRSIGVENFYTVDSQMIPDGNFPTVKSPNPEDKEGFNLAITLARKNKADLIIGTDPDSDRLGCLVRHGGEYAALTGNQMGVLMLNYIIKARKANGTLPENACAVKTIVSTDMATALCRKHGVAIDNVFTGFKFIGEKIKTWEENGEKTFIFGFEESYGYLGGTYCRDKDGVFAAMLITFAAADCRRRGVTLVDDFNKLYSELGYYTERTESVYLEGLDGLQRMKRIMSSLRENRPLCIGDYEVTSFTDYLSGETISTEDGKFTSTAIKGSDVLVFGTGDSSVTVRPSGTEPKLKIYFLVKGESVHDAENKTRALKEDMISIINER